MHLLDLSGGGTLYVFGAGIFLIIIINKLLLVATEFGNFSRLTNPDYLMVFLVVSFVQMST